MELSSCISISAYRLTGILPERDIELTGLARVLRKTPASIEADLGELDRSGVCECCGDGIEIRDPFWPYHKQAAVAASNPQADFVRQAREAFLKRACVRSTFTAADEKLALNLCQRGVSLEQLRWAIWLGCARKYMAMLNGQTRVPITSLAYFATLIDEVSQPDTSASYWEYVRGRMEEWEKRWLQTRRSAADYGCRSRRTIVARNDLTNANGATDQVAPLQRNRAPHAPESCPTSQRNRAPLRTESAARRNEMMETK